MLASISCFVEKQHLYVILKLVLVIVLQNAIAFTPVPKSSSNSTGNTSELTVSAVQCWKWSPKLLTLLVWEPEKAKICH